MGVFLYSAGKNMTLSGIADSVEVVINVGIGSSYVTVRTVARSST